MSERTIEPYRLARTRRGWEVDAGPLDTDGAMRTFLLSNIRKARLRDDAFELPPDLPRLLEQQRATTGVRVELPQSARWAADMYAEQVTVVDDGELTVQLDLDLLPPVRRRLGQLLLVCGPSARVVDRPDLADCGRQLATELLEHFGEPVTA